MEIIMNYKILIIISLFLTSGQSHAMKRNYEDFRLDQDGYDQSEILEEVEENPSKLEKLDTQELLDLSNSPAMLIPLTSITEIAAFDTRPISSQCIFCEKSFDNKKSTSNHSRIHQKDGFYYCPYPGCKVKANKLATLEDKHYKPKHLQEDALTCRDCGQDFSTKTSLDRHLKKCKKQPLTCPKCKKNYGSKQAYSKHYNECFFDKGTESTSGNLYNQASENISEKAASEQFTEHLPLEIPLSSGHDQRKDTNQDNQPQTTSSDFYVDLSSRTQSKSIIKKLNCPHCDLQETFNPPDLAKHIKAKHKDNFPYPCSICIRANKKNKEGKDMGFETKMGLYYHNKKSHENIRYQCSECDSILSTKGHAEKHVKTKHPEIKNYASLIKQITITSGTTNQFAEQHSVQQAPINTVPFTPRTEQIFNEIFADDPLAQSSQSEKSTDEQLDATSLESNEAFQEEYQVSRQHFDENK
jgi:hypothetical protein